MILGLSVQAFTLLHVLISLVGIATGLFVAYGLLIGQVYRSWTAWFLVTTVLTSVTGFFFHSKSFGPPHIVGVISLLVLAIAIYALYSAHLAGGWRRIYVITGLLALYLNVFVLVTQIFQKIAPFRALAPNGNEPPFLIAQVVVLIAFVAIGVGAFRRR